MKEILTFESPILVISLLFAFLAWSLYGEEAVEKFAPDLKASSNNEKFFRRRKTLGMLSEMLRAVEVAIISTLIYVTSVESTAGIISLSELIGSPWFRIPVMVASSLTIIWCAYLGPWMLMNDFSKYKNFWDKHVRRKIRLPYLMWIPYLIGVFYLMGGIIVAVLVGCVKLEAEALSGIENSIRSIQGTNLESILRATLELNRFGRSISFYSQKYILVSILAIIFVIIEQHSYMKKTQWLGNLDIMKSGVVVLFSTVLVVSLLYMPMIYHGVHSQLETALDSLMINLNVSSENTDPFIAMREMYKYLESYDLPWLYGNIITGYGNIITLIVIGGSFLLRNFFFKEFPFNKITKLMLPSFLMNAIEKALGTFGIKSGSVEEETIKPDLEFE
jgi:hypothetical protein